MTFITAFHHLHQGSAESLPKALPPIAITIAGCEPAAVSLSEVAKAGIVIVMGALRIEGLGFFTIALPGNAITLKSFSHPERVHLVPHVSFVIIDFIFLQGLSKLAFESLSPMMHFLVENILLHSFNI